ncbi:TetR/AcrR family transcriptional regulator [Halobacillus shinanisalinarum]|uniref:TetR/AcrR family transcriptional regulator n=1 Tax=Halobacillus shinanisalinarum TaxID=2932258 RepID=A0ABY4H2Q4_9BACI|nr:TetR/AcrR family transcriptional regulator [Halobacillus shinanisalinarum]UOQ94737.1 TetR/AcrR family transcriptional regulator [Halobacillus shinanisalinarum]
MGRQEVIDAAINQYALNGYHGATLQKIAQEVGIKPASVYFYYKNKESLFTAAFQRILDRHFAQMKKIMKEVEDRHIEVIFHSLLDGTVSYHKENTTETTAYISLVTSPIPEIKEFIQKYMLTFNDWLKESLYSNVKRDYPHISEDEIAKINKQYILIANGVFWGIHLYKDDDFAEQIHLAREMIANVLHQIPAKQ